MTNRNIRCVLIATAATLLAGVSARAQTNKLYINSQPGDYIGGGQKVTYPAASGTFSAGSFGTNVITISFHTPDWSHSWSLEFAATEGQVLGAGMYEGPRAIRSTRRPTQAWPSRVTATAATC
jgi:hypothetical protein